MIEFNKAEIEVIIDLIQQAWNDGWDDPELEAAFKKLSAARDGEAS